MALKPPLYVSVWLRGAVGWARKNQHFEWGFMRSIFVLPSIIAVATAAPAWAATPTPAEVVFSKLRVDLNSQLLDYPSARFQNVHLINMGDGRVGVCGEVNAKNRMGAYVGWTKFGYVPGLADITSIPSSRVPMENSENMMDRVEFSVLCGVDGKPVLPVDPDHAKDAAFRP